MESIADTSSQVFNALRLEYEDVEEDGKLKTLNNAMKMCLLKHWPG